MRKAFFTALLLALTPVLAHAQNTGPEMADKLRGEGKIYVVVLVLATIFAGIIGFLVRLDRKISRLEKNNS
ncbi:MAG: CcmD family protein [Bacteroidetes bacterium]|nr:CcmD family protein [Bacteroidota bacterium]